MSNGNEISHLSDSSNDLFTSLDETASLGEQIRAHGTRLQDALLDSVRIAETSSAALDAADKQLKELKRTADSQARELRSYREQGRRRQEAEQARLAAEQEQATAGFLSAYAAGEQKLDPVAKPPSAVFSERTQGSSIRYLALQVMKYADENIELAGIAMAMNMVAEDVDRLPQGDHAR